jgi:hypothetical protein
LDEEFFRDMKKTIREYSKKIELSRIKINFPSLNAFDNKANYKIDGDKEAKIIPVELNALSNICNPKYTINTIIKNNSECHKKTRVDDFIRYIYNPLKNDIDSVKLQIPNIKKKLNIPMNSKSPNIPLNTNIFKKS